MKISYTIYGNSFHEKDIIKYMKKVEKISYVVGGNLTNYLQLTHSNVLIIIVDLLIKEEEIYKRIHIFIWHNKEILEVYEELINGKLNDINIEIEYSEDTDPKQPIFYLDRETSIEFITNLKNMLFNATCKSKSARK